MNELQSIQVNGDTVSAIGNPVILQAHKIGVLSSRKCPAARILEAHERFKQFAAEDRTVVSGFHSPLERECLRLMLRDGGKIIICLARGLGTMRIKKEWRPAVGEGRLLLISQFKPEIRHITKEQTLKRNQLVISLADELYTPYVANGGELSRLL